MRILGVDPGLTRCGLGMIEAGAGRQVALIEVSVAKSTADDALDGRIADIADAVDAIIEKHQPDAIAMERVFSQLNVSTVMGVAHISGYIMVAARRKGIPIALYTPSEVKAAVTGQGRADKAQVGAMVQRILKLDELPKPADAADALAVAIAHAWRGGVQTVAGGAVTDAQAQWAAAERAARRRS